MFTGWEVASRISMNIMLCAKYMHLSQRYGVALRRWAQAESSLNKTELPVATRRLGQEIEKKAREERNTAYARMLSHCENCPVCNEKA
jgi:hypothetical protein